MRVVLMGGWQLDGVPQVILNMNAGLGPAPAGYLSMRSGAVEVFVTPDEMRQLWDAYAEFQGLAPRP